MRGLRFVFPILFASAALLGQTGSVHAAPVPTAVFGFELFDDTEDRRENVLAEQAARLKLVNGELERLLSQSGEMAPVDLQPSAARIEELSPLFKCNGCEGEVAAAAGARLEAVGVIRKVSNLILSFTLHVREVGAGEKILRAGQVDIRGNTDESWLRGVRYLVKNRILAPGQPDLPQ